MPSEILPPQSWDYIASEFGLPLVPDAVSPVDSSGFSGTLLWRVTNGGQSVVVRRYPAAVKAERLQEIYQVVAHVAANGCPCVPVPLLSRSGECFLRWEERLWQVEPAMPGNADYSLRPSPQRLRSALVSLAQWHLAASTCSDSRSGVAPGILARLHRVQRIQSEQLLARLTALKTSGGRLARLIEPLVDGYRQQAAALTAALHEATTNVVPIQYCIRDIHHEHVLFAARSANGSTGDEVSGIVDYDAVRLDCVAADLSRLLRSFAPDSVIDWDSVTKSYAQVRPLAVAEVALLSVYDLANRLLSGLSWLDWIFLQQRCFDEARVEQRLEELLVGLSLSPSVDD